MFNNKSERLISKSLVFLMIIMTVMSYMPLGISPIVKTAEAVEKNNINNLASEAIQNNYDAYMSGTAVDASYGKFNSYDAYILMKAGIDLSQWKYNELSFADSVIELIDNTIEKETTESKAAAKRVAQDYLAAKSLGETEKANQLMEILENRQQESGELDNGLYGIYSNLPAYDLLAREGYLNNSDLNIDNVVLYILDNQDETKAWPIADEVNYITNDFMSTSQAVRVLKAAEHSTSVTPSAIQSAITGGMIWLQSKQQEDGSYKAGWDDAVTDTSEIIYTAKILGEEPSTWVNSSGKSPVEYMINNAYIDDSFGNIPATTWALDSYLQLGSKISSINQLAYKAINNNFDSFSKGIAVDAGYGNFNSYDGYILMKAGVNIRKWYYNGNSFAESLLELIDDTLAKESTDSKASAKRVAQDYLVAKSLEEFDKANRLIEIIKNRQTELGELDNGVYGIYSNLPAYDLLAREGELSNSGLNIDNAVLYVLNNQDETKAWPIANEASYITNDFMSTVQAVRVLKAAENNTSVTPSAIQSAITGGMKWLQSKQQEDGSYKAGWDDAVTDTSEMIYTAKVLGEEPSTWISSFGKSPVDYMINNAYVSDSFGNIPATTWALDAYLQLRTMILSDGKSDNDTSTPKPGDSSFKVKVAVIGKDGEVVYGPKSVSVSSEDDFGSTAMSALDATGLSWKFGETKGFVEEIDGQRNKGNNGWMYAVNGKSPSVLSINKSVKSGDQILWWYSTSAMKGMPDWPNSSSNIVANNENIDEVKKLLVTNSEKIKDKNIILNFDNKMTEKEAKEILKEINSNLVSLSGEYKNEEIILSDGEVSILLSDKALKNKVNITAREIKSNDNPKQYAIKLNSSVYEFGPDGTKFNELVVISIKVAIDENTDIDRLGVAWFDENSNKWTPIPCLIDLKTGVVTFTIDHFTKFAVIEKEKRISFNDVDDTLFWAKDAVEILAGQGIVKGTLNGFEPQRPITRAEFMSMIVKSLNYDVKPSTKMVFSDVDKSEWYVDVVECGHENNIVTGDPDGRFRPNDSISRNEIAVILSRLEKINNIEGYDLAMSDNASIPEWAIKGVKFAAKEKLMSGYEDNTFRGSKPMTRAEVAVVIYRYLNSSLK